MKLIDVGNISSQSPLFCESVFLFGDVLVVITFFLMYIKKNYTLQGRKRNYTLPPQIITRNVTSCITSYLLRIVSSTWKEEISSITCFWGMGWEVKLGYKREKNFGQGRCVTFIAMIIQ